VEKFPGAYQGYRQKAQLHIHRGNDEQALQALSQALEKAGPQDSDIHSLMSNTAYRMGNLTQALEYGRRAYVANPLSHGVLANYIRLLSDTGQFERAEALINEQLLLSPDSQQLHFLQSQLYFEFGYPDRAADALMTGTQTNDGNASRSAIRKALIECRWHQAERGLASLEAMPAAIQWDIFHIAAMYNCLSVLDPQQALLDFTRRDYIAVAESNIRGSQAYFIVTAWRALALLLNSRDEEALELLKSLSLEQSNIRMRPAHDIRFAAYTLYAMKKLNDEQTTAFEEAVTGKLNHLLKEQAGSPLFHLAVTEFYAVKQDWPRAQSHLRKAILSGLNWTTWRINSPVLNADEVMAHFEGILPAMNNASLK